MTAGELPAWLGADASRTRGEFVMVLHAIVEGAATQAEDAKMVEGHVSARTWRFKSSHPRYLS